jgi:hypothetical protein
MPLRRGDAEARERLAIVKRGQILGFGALILTLATIVTLAAIGQPWVAGTVVTTGLAVIVAIFVTGEYQPAPFTSLKPRRLGPFGYLNKSSRARPRPPLDAIE